MTRITIRATDTIEKHLEVRSEGKKIGSATREQPGLYRIVLTDPPLEKRARVREQFRDLELVDAITDLIAAQAPA